MKPVTGLARGAGVRRGRRAGAGRVPGRTVAPPHASPSSSSSSNAAVVVPGDTVLVAGATGGVGQILTKKLVERGYVVRALSRSRSKSMELLGTHPNLTHVEADITRPETLVDGVRGCRAVCCTTGTTAFPTLRWLGKNDPDTNTWVGTRNLVDACREGKECGRFVFVSSAGVKRYDAGPPYSILNAFGVLVAKEKAETYLANSGMPYTIVRPGRLTDAPYTSYDLNTLMKGESGERREVNLSLEEELDGETSRAAVAESCVQSLVHAFMENETFSIESVLGEGPETSDEEWASRLRAMRM